ncbi:hypothetical protein NESM_000389000 [Novymonas esmeraldas]|uniref:Uncharacterized protein n=1 Tax=Novymonas esmeraldas TaxID=1808958 RepID=A0AAW0EN38_9TRYP
MKSEGVESGDSSSTSRTPPPIVRRDRQPSTTGGGGSGQTAAVPQEEPSPATSPVSTPQPPSGKTGSPAAAVVSPTDTTPTPAAGDALASESKEFLIRRVQALERQLTIRNNDCARLLEERSQLLPLREKCESQREMILALRSQLDLAQAQRESANDAMEAMKRQQRDTEHRERIERAERAMYGAAGGPKTNAAGLRKPDITTPSPSGAPPAPSPPSSHMHPARRAPGGTVVNTASGPQILYNSSDISSVGFATNARLPYDFLGGPGAQVQYLTRHRNNAGRDAAEEPEGGVDASDDAQVRRTMAAAAEAVQMDTKYAEMEDKEHEALLARLKALRNGPR